MAKHGKCRYNQTHQKKYLQCLYFLFPTLIKQQENSRQNRRHKTKAKPRGSFSPADKGGRILHIIRARIKQMDRILYRHPGTFQKCRYHWQQNDSRQKHAKHGSCPIFQNISRASLRSVRKLISIRTTTYSMVSSANI